MNSLRRLAPLALGFATLAGLGALVAWTEVGANGSARAVHREDRQILQETLAAFGNQYMAFALAEAREFAGSADWSLAEGDTSDRRRLERFVESSRVFNHGAVLTSSAVRPLSVFSRGGRLPDRRDPAYTTLIAGLVAQKPAVSGVMSVDGAPVVALAVPVVRGVSPRAGGAEQQAVFIGYFRTDVSALQSYIERLHYGTTARASITDGSGRIVASTDRSALGTVLDSGPVLDQVALGRRGFSEYTRGERSMVASYAPLGAGGWAAVTEQEAAEFYDRAPTGGRRLVLAVVALLLVVAAVLGLKNHSRQIALRKAHDEKGRLLATTTHELKTPLTAIRGSALTLGMRWRDLRPEQVDHFLGVIHRRCDGLQKLIDRILMGARLESGHEQPVNPVPLALAPVATAIAAEFADASPRHTFEVAVDAAITARADADAVEQVLGLLVENAVKYSPDGGMIRVSAEAAEREVVVRVADPGIGIAREDLARVFEPYFRSTRPSGQYGGVGLGLAIARHLVRRHGGDIGVTSALGSGSVFWFTLPRAPAGRAAAPAAADAS